MNAGDVVWHLEDVPFEDHAEVMVDVGDGRLAPVATVEFDGEHGCFVITCVNGG